MNTWIDYTRRNDPAQEYYVSKLAKMITKQTPDVLCFWTKNPGFIVEHYTPMIKELVARGTIVLAQVTVNTGYGKLEPNVNTTDHGGLSDLCALLGPGRVRVRFDPIILGFTTPGMFERCVEACFYNGVERITTNFLVPSYKGVGKLLKEKYGIDARVATNAKRVRVLRRIVNIAAIHGIEVAGCAEIYRDGIDGQVPGLIRAGCSDASWAQQFNPGLIFTQRSSRPGCQCCYSGDWGVYASRGGPPCPHQCVYCYAK